MDFRRLVLYVDKSREMFTFLNTEMNRKLEKRLKKTEILFNFWIAEKRQRHMKLIFLTKEKKKERNGS